MLVSLPRHIIRTSRRRRPSLADDAPAIEFGPEVRDRAELEIRFDYLPDRSRLGFVGHKTTTACANFTTE
jgi:hypothetical protein